MRDARDRLASAAAGFWARAVWWAPALCQWGARSGVRENVRAWCGPRSPQRTLTPHARPHMPCNLPSSPQPTMPPAFSAVQSTDARLGRRQSSVSQASAGSDASHYEALLPQGTTALQRAMSEIGPPGAHQAYQQAWSSGPGHHGAHSGRATTPSPEFAIPPVPEGIPTALASVLGDLERELDLLDAQGVGGGSPDAEAAPRRSPEPLAGGFAAGGASAADDSLFANVRESTRPRQALDAMRLSADLHRARNVLEPSRGSARPRSRLLAGRRVRSTPASVCAAVYHVRSPSHGAWVVCLDGVGTVQLRPNPNLSGSVSRKRVGASRGAPVVSGVAPSPPSGLATPDAAPPQTPPQTPPRAAPKSDTARTPGGDAAPRPASRRRKSSDASFAAAGTPPIHPRRPSAAGSASGSRAGGWGGSDVGGGCVCVSNACVCGCTDYDASPAGSEPSRRNPASACTLPAAAPCVGSMCTAVH